MAGCVAGARELWQDLSHLRLGTGAGGNGDATMIDYAAARQAMVDRQVRPSDVTTYSIISALLDIPREAFVPENLKPIAYFGEHLTLGPNRVLLDPWSFSKLLETVEIRRHDLVLDVGCGLGYSAAVIARLAEAVIAVEEDEEMARTAEETLSNMGADNAVVHAGPLAGGAPEHGPYDVVLIEGGVGELPAAIIDQVKIGGRIGAIFSDGTHGQGRLGIKTESGTVWRRIFDSTAPILHGFERTKSFEF